MTLEESITIEFSNEFDILYNNVMSNTAPGLTEYEKSVFLTKAQNEILKNYFNPQGNKYKEGFDGSPKRQIDFSRLVSAVSPEVYADSYTKFDNRSVVYKLPSDILFILNETATNIVDGIAKNINIVPISFGEYSKLMQKPYKQPLKNQGWRLFQSTTENYVAEVIVKAGTTLSNYKIRYVKKPTPIILTDLTESGVSIEGIQVVTTCALDPILYPDIIERAVELAKSAYIGDLNSAILLGQRTE